MPDLPPLGRTDKLAHAKSIRLLALDVDGVLTDGSINLDDQGVETKRFNVFDGQGIAAWLRLGYDVAVITRRSGKALEHRCRELGIARLVQGSKDKSGALDELLKQTGLNELQIAYIGDDWPDIPVLERVGFPACPPHADRFIAARCAYRCARAGGHGAVREVIEHLLAAQNRLEDAVNLYAKPER